MASVNTNDCDPNESVATRSVEVLLVDETASDTHTVPTFYRAKDIPADEMALSIDHIREQLFSLLTVNDLFKCRGLNRVWNSYATVELQERFELKYTIMQGETLKVYLNLLQKHQLIFPCLPLPIFRKYSFEMVTLDILGDPFLQQFLRTYGYFIRDLSLLQNTFCYSYMLPRDNDFVEQVRNLLLHSAPNLSSFRMDREGFQMKWDKKRIGRMEDSACALLTAGPEFKEIESIPETCKNENLKFFSFNPISGKMFDLAIQLAPNLEEIQVRPTPDGRDHKHFIEPVNRLRLCKEMQYNTYSSDLFKRFADLGHEGDLKLRQFSFMFGREDRTDDSPSLDPAFFESYYDDDVDAISKILASSWDSLETIRWKWMKPVPGLQWPGMMPNVLRIDLGPHHGTLEDGFLVFPMDIVWSTIFPKLRELQFCEAIESSGFPQLLHCFNRQCIDTVEEVHVLAENSEEHERNATTLANLEQLRRLFPSA